MVGLRVFDVGALIVWLVWFFRLRDDDDDDGDDFRGGDGDEPEPEEPTGPSGGLRHPAPRRRALALAPARPPRRPRTRRPFRTRRGVPQPVPARRARQKTINAVGIL